jgi:hypothetical protein
VPAADDQAMVKALLADGPDPTLGDGVGVGRPNRRADDLGTVERQTSSNALVNLVSRSRIRNLNAAARSPSATRRLRACWATHGPVEWAVTPATCTCRLPSSMTNSTYSRRGQTVSTVKKSQARMSVACRRRNDRQVVWARRGAGSMPWAPSTLRIELAEIGQPRPSSSPQTVGSPTADSPGRAGGSAAAPRRELAVVHQFVAQHEDLDLLRLGRPTAERASLGGPELGARVHHDAGDDDHCPTARPDDPAAWHHGSGKGVNWWLERPSRSSGRMREVSWLAASAARNPVTGMGCTSWRAARASSSATGHWSGWPWVTQ